MKNKHKLSTFDIVVTIIMAIVLFICIYPFIYELAISLSDGKAVAAGRITFYSIGTNLQSYFYILTAERLGIVKGFVNSVVYTGLGTVAADGRASPTPACRHPTGRRRRARRRAAAAG